MRFTKSMTTRDWVLAILVFGGVFALGALAITGYANANHATGMVNPTIENHYNNMQSSLDMVNQTMGAVTQPGGLSLIGAISVFSQGLLAVLNIILSSLLFVPTMLFSLIGDFGLDSTAGYIFLSVLAGGATVLVIFAILNASKLAGRV